MQKLMIMRLCNTSERRDSVNDSQECVCASYTGMTEVALNTLGPDAPRCPLMSLSPLLPTSILNRQTDHPARTFSSSSWMWQGQGGLGWALCKKAGWGRGPSQGLVISK